MDVRPLEFSVCVIVLGSTMFRIVTWLIVSPILVSIQLFLRRGDAGGIIGLLSLSLSLDYYVIGFYIILGATISTTV